MFRQSNPLLVHRIRSATGNVLDGWLEDRDILNDGFFLAQRSGDASRAPLILRQDETITTPNFSISDITGGYRFKIFLSAAPTIPGAYPDLTNDLSYRMAYIHEDDDELRAGEQETEGPLYIFIQATKNEGVELEDDPRVTFTMDSGHAFTICLPTDMSIPAASSAALALWVAEDGSTYWANAAKTYGTSLSAVFDRDAWYAIRWASDNLARAAHDSLGVSPAVNAGSKDWLNGGYTNRDLDTRDNPSPDKRGGFDNADSSGNPEPWEDCNNTAGTADDLDIGYHYGAACYNAYGNKPLTPQETIAFAVTLRHPKEAVAELEYEITNEIQFITPDITAYRKLAIASSTYQGETKTIACFPSPIIEMQNYEDHMLVMYKIFRGDETSHGCLDHQLIEIDDDEEDSIKAMVAMTAGSGAEFSTMSEPIYAATGFITSDYYYTENYERAVNTTTTLNIYRYEPSGDPSDWIKIGEFSDTVGTESQVVDLSLAASGNDLSVFWLYKNQDANRREIWGYKITDAATRTTSQNFAPGGAFYTPDTGNELGLTINTDQDGQGDNSVLITWTEKFGSYSDKICRTGEVLYTIGQPSEIYPIHNLSSDIQHD